MSVIQTLEKTVWTLQNLKEEEMTTESLEIILNFFDKIKFEINANKFYSKFTVDFDNYLNYSTHIKESQEQNQNNNLFESKYHHALITGTYQLNQDDQIITFNIEKVFTNEEQLYESQLNEIMKAKINKTNMIFTNDSFLNKSLDCEDIVLKLNSQLKK